MSQLYIPTKSKTTRDIELASRRLLLVGEPGSGKTFSSVTTSPNPVILDIDNGITDPRLIALSAVHIPLYDELYCKEVLKKNSRCNAIKEFLKTDGIKFAKEQTLIIDSLSALEDDVQQLCWDLTPVSTKSGNKDGMAFWGLIKDYWTDFFTLIQRLPCNVILISHLAEKRDKENGILLGYGPMVDGSIKQEIGRFFTDVVKQFTKDKKEKDGTITTEYLWQVKADSYFTAKSRAECNGLYLPANFNHLISLGETKKEK